MRNWKPLLAIAVFAGSWGGSGGVARGQTFERDTTITGPRGRTIQRQVEIKRGPGTIQRDIQITRPGGTFDRQVQLQRTPVPGRGFIPGPWPRPPWWGPRPLVIAQPAPAFGLGLMAAPFLNFSFGGGGGGGFGGGPGGPGPGGPGPGGGAQAPPPPDQVALQCQRCQSFSPSARKDAAYTLGRLGDPRAVPSLVHLLKYDNFKDVRVAAAIALGEVGGSDAAVALERASIYDHREDVRKAATAALNRLNAKAKATAAAPPPAAASSPSPSPPAAAAPSPFRDSAPAAEGSGVAPEALPSQQPELTPPPPPTPVAPGASAGSNP
ncbi:MAG TPA: HEAT repeat domain-containing protein [Isosphaeraceae bacterium]|nr:HEAT repeat domain-containing protein [Isosphaeraceae bacterium]